MSANVPDPLETIHTLRDLSDLVAQREELYLRYSEGPTHDADGGSVDMESGLVMPGLSTNPLHPESWWSRPLPDWIARQICQYADVASEHPERFAWVLTGHVAGRGPDCEPLLTDIVPLRRLDDRVLDEATRVYHARFDVGSGPGEGES